MTAFELQLLQWLRLRSPSCIKRFCLQLSHSTQAQRYSSTFLQLASSFNNLDKIVLHMGKWGKLPEMATRSQSFGYLHWTGFYLKSVQKSHLRPTSFYVENNMTFLLNATFITKLLPLQSQAVAS